MVESIRAARTIFVGEIRRSDRVVSGKERARLRSVRTPPSTKKAGAPEPLKDGERASQRRLKDQAATDEHLREQAKTEVEEHPYLDTEGAE